MYTLLTVLIIIACILMILIVLIQNPKGGGLSGTFGGFSDQMMGVQRTTDFLEKATWTLAIVLLSFSLLTSFFLPRGEELPQKRESAIESEIQNAPLPFNVPQNQNSVPPQQQQQQQQQQQSSQNTADDAALPIQPVGDDKEN